MNATTTTTDWGNLLPDVVPQAVPALLGEREDHPRSFRVPKDVAAGILELAKAADQEFSTVAIYLMKAALAEVKAARSKKRLLKKS